MADRPDEATAEGVDVAALLEGATVYEDPHALVADGTVDVLWITYRADETPAIVASAIEQGVHVLCEKPIGRTAADVEPLAERAAEAGVTVAPTTFYRQHPVVRDLRRRVADGFFGDVLTVEGRFNASRLRYRDTDHYLYDRAASRGGALQWIGPHWLDVMPWILDDPIERVNARLHPAAECDVEAGAVLQFETAGGTLGTFHTGYYLDERGKDTHLGLYGTAGQARSPVHHDALTHEPSVPLTLSSGDPGWSATPRRTVAFEIGYERFPAWGDPVLDYFAAYFDGYETGDVPATVDDAVALLRVLDAAYASAGRESWVDVDG